MKKKRKVFFQKAVSIITGLFLVFQSLTPGFLISSQTFAQEEPVETPTPTVVPAPEQPNNNEVTPTVTPAIALPTPDEEVVPTSTPIIEPTVIITPEPTQEISPTIEPQKEEPLSTPSDPPKEASPPVTPTPIETPTPSTTPEPTPEVIEQTCEAPSQTRTTSDYDWSINEFAGTTETRNNVELGVTYVFPKNTNVSITFTCLPKDLSKRTPLKIQEIAISELNLPDGITAATNYAYDITTGMQDGTFKYNVTLPKTDEANAEISYIEKSIQEATTNEVKTEDIKQIEANKIEQENSKVKASDIDHFTIFIVVNPDETDANHNVVNQDYGWISDNLYATFDSSSDYADYGFPNLGIPSGSTIEGIEVFVEGNTTGRDLDISLWNKSNSSPDNYTSSKTANLGSTENTIAVGGATDKWGKTWTDTDFDTDFKVRVDANSGSGTTAYLDMIQVKVYYTAPVITPTLPYNPSDDYALTSISGIWTAVTGGSNINGLNTQEVRWGNSTGYGQSGLKFEGSGIQSFNEGNNFYLGALTHFNWPIQNPASGAKLKISLQFSKPTISPNPDFTYDFVIDETSNNWPCNSGWQQSATPCDDKVTFPNSYGEKSFQIGDKLYTLRILGFVNSYPSGTPITQFVTEEQKNNTAFLVGTLSSILVAAPQISLVQKAVNGEDADTTPGQNLYIGDTANFTYSVQNTGNVTMTGIVVHDDKGITVTCPKTTLLSGESMTCIASSTVIAGQYTNTAHVHGTYNSTQYTSNNESANYFGISRPADVKITLCHSTSSESNPYNKIEVDINSTSKCLDANGHGLDPNDIIPSYTYDTCTYPGLNLTTLISGVTGQQILNNGCVIPPTKGTLIVKKVVINDNGGTKEATDFSFQVNGGTSTAFEADGQNDLSLDPNTYTVTETPVSGYDITYSNCSGIKLGAGETKTCTITNNDISPKITVTKIVNGSTEPITSFPLSIKNLTHTYPVNSGQQYTINAGTWTVTETNKTGYTATITGDCAADGTIILNPGDTKACTITNKRDTGVVTFEKIVDDGSSVLGWLFTVKDDAGATIGTYHNGDTATLPTGSYTVTESGATHYSFQGASGICTTNPTNGVISMGVTKAGGTCTFTNVYVPYCGDGMKNQGTEQCDDGNTADGDGCSSTCQEEPGTITFIKNASPHDTQSFHFTYGSNPYPIGDFSLIDDDNGDASEQVTFSSIPAGTYAWTEDTLDDWGITDISCQETKTNNSTTSVALRKATVTLDPGETVTCTFTNTRKTYPLFVTKFEDLNNNATFDAGEPSLDGWTMELYTNNECAGSPSASVITNSDITPGTAKFDALYSGQTYWIKEVESSTDWINTTGNCVLATIHDDLHSNNTVTFGNFMYGSLSGHKFEDVDNSHSFNTGEPYIPEWNMRVYKSNNDGGWTSIDTQSTNSDGIYEVHQLGIGTYKVCEVAQSGWQQTYPDTGVNRENSDEALYCYQFDITQSGQQIEKDFGNIHTGDVVVTKFEDLNGNGTWDKDTESVLNDWEINVSGQKSQLTGSGDNNKGEAAFNRLVDGTYYLSETEKEGWKQTGIYCETSGIGTKITQQGEAYGHHGYCEGWNQCGDAKTCAQWACEINGYTTLVSYGADKPCTQFNNCHLFHSRGSIQWNWGNWCNVQGVTDIVCTGRSLTMQSSESTTKSTETESNFFLPIEKVNAQEPTGYPVTVTAGGKTNCYIGNQYIPAKLEVSKENNATTTLFPGSSVLYTLTITSHDNTSYGVKLTDLLPKGFVYRAGSWTASSDKHGALALSEPTYHSPGTWDIGTIEKDEVITLTLLADIATDEKPGTYKDLALAYGCQRNGDCELGGTNSITASAVDPGQLDDLFVGTEVTVVKDQQDSKTLTVNREVKEEGSVLGATTELPSTGAHAQWIFVALSFVVTGIGFVIVSRKMRRYHA